MHVGMKSEMFAALLLLSPALAAQQPIPSQTGYLTPTQLGLYVFPAKNQNSAQQSVDEQNCYAWAVGQAKFNPILGGTPSTDSAALAAAHANEQATQGAAVGGAARGAVAGVAIGAIAGNAGEGAAIGAVVGGMAGFRARREAAAEAGQEAAQQATQDSITIMNNFKRAMSACLTGKGYSVN
jgi:uncharacterized protein YcfJ